LQAANVPPSEIWIEDRSRSTHENAVFSAEILRRREFGGSRWWWSASMPRAVACFRNQGIDVVAAPAALIPFSYRGGLDSELEGTRE
jgi:uncharacterized SAM-binding protein YcdF (DUF218 family)